MRIDPVSLRVVHGVTVYGPRVDNVSVISDFEGGDWDWLIDGKIIAGPGHFKGGSYRLWELDVTTPGAWPTLLTYSDGREVELAADRFHANGRGQWIAGYDTLYFDHAGLELPQTLGVAISDSGQIHRIPWNSNEDRGGRYLGDDLFTRPQYCRVARDHEGRVWSVEWVEGLGTCLRLWGTNTGIVVAITDHDFYPDVAIHSSGLLVMASSFDAGDVRLQSYTIDPNQRLVALVPLPKVRAFDRPMFVGVFDDAFTAAPANTPPIGPSYPTQWVDLEYGATKSRTHEEIWGYATRPRWIYAPPSHRAELAASLLPGDEIWTPAYRRKGESLAAFRVRVMTDLEQLATLGHPIEIVAGAEDFGTLVKPDLTEAECLECFPLYRELCDVSPLIRGVRFFAWDRANGVAKYPSFKPWISAFVAASSGVPDQSLPAPPPVPKKSVSLMFRFKEFTTMSFTIPRVLGPENFKKLSNGKEVCIISNPLKDSFVGFPPAGTVLIGPKGDRVLASPQPNGELWAQEEGDPGGFEEVTRANGLATWRAQGSQRFQVPCAD